ncbi:MAG: helix-turn-helix domain-containing protein [Candidatus Gastranaerophilaceae bacterium]|jgi:transcriptional regulator with XRE-family HTH domain|nr:helix-turn-helix transcriptional regulator [Christensenellales bacterium]
MFDKNIFSQRLRSLRKAKNLNQNQLGQAVGLTQFAISKIERAERAASIEVICALADYFDISVDYLIGRSDNPNRR